MTAPAEALAGTLTVKVKVLKPPPPARVVPGSLLIVKVPVEPLGVVVADQPAGGVNVPKIGESPMFTVGMTSVMVIVSAGASPPLVTVIVYIKSVVDPATIVRGPDLATVRSTNGGGLTVVS